MSYRIYIDESGTHENKWLVIGMLFVPNHGALHSDLCKDKDNLKYLNTSPKNNNYYREIHFADFHSTVDQAIGEAWINTFVKHNCFYRSIVIDWDIYDGKHFGDAFDPPALKKRRAYKKWTEMLIQPELTSPTLERIIEADLYLDRLKPMYQYDVIPHLEDRFTKNYEGDRPYIRKFQHVDSKKDANQCLQLCDLLTGCLHQELVPSERQAKLATRDYLKNSLKQFGVREFRPEFWRGYDGKTLRDHFPKYSAWFWRPMAPKDRKEHKRRR